VTFLNSLTMSEWALAAVVPAGILALYFLRLRRRPVEVSSTMLWKRAIEDVRVNALWQRLRQNILLLLQLSAVALLLAALVRPAWNATTTGNHVVILLDQSASMNATDVRPSRLEVAKQRALELIEQMRPGDAAMVIAFSDTARVAASYTEDQPALRRAIESIRPTDNRTDLAQALIVASGLANPGRTLEDAGDAEIVPIDPSATTGIAATVYVISDGRFAQAEDFSPGNLAIRYLKVGEGKSNVAVLALAAREATHRSNQWEIFGRVANFGDAPAKTVVELRVAGQRVDVQSVELTAGGESGVTFRLPIEQTGEVSLHLAGGDALSTDDAGYLSLSPARPARVLKIGGSNPPLEAVLATPTMTALARVESWPAERAKDDLAALTERETYDLVIFDRCRPTSMPASNTWFVGEVPEQGADHVRAVENPSILNWDSVHPALRFLDLDDVSLFGGQATQGRDEWTSLIESDKGWVMWTMPRGVYTDLVMSTPLVDGGGEWRTDWPLKPSFPLFVMNTVRWLGGVEVGRDTLMRTGEAIVTRVPDGVELAKARWPSGREQEIRVGTGGRVEWLDTTEVGFYRLTSGEEEQAFGVNLYDEVESDIAPAEEIQVGTQATNDTSSEQSRLREIWKWLAVAGLLVLLTEWYIYNRRVSL
jgi:hypothetical protein